MNRHTANNAGINISTSKGIANGDKGLGDSPSASAWRLMHTIAIIDTEHEEEVVRVRLYNSPAGHNVRCLIYAAQYDHEHNRYMVTKHAAHLERNNTYLSECMCRSMKGAMTELGVTYAIDDMYCGMDMVQRMASELAISLGAKDARFYMVSVGGER